MNIYYITIIEKTMKGLNIIVTNLSGYSFEVKWNRNTCLVKRKIAEHHNEN